LANYRKHTDDPDYSQGHHESDWERESRIIGRAIERREEQDMQDEQNERLAQTPQVPEGRAPAVTVSIDVTAGSYGGQRDQWQEGTMSYAVSMADDGDTVSLTYPGNPGINRRVIRFSKAGLWAALKILEEYRP